MKKHEIILIDIAVVIIFILINELLYLFNFTPFSMGVFLSSLISTNIFVSYLILFTIALSLKILFSLLVNRFYYLFNKVRIYVIASICDFFLLLLTISLLTSINENIGVYGYFSLFLACLTSTTTLLYSIFYLNLIEYERIKGDVEDDKCK